MAKKRTAGTSTKKKSRAASASRAPARSAKAARRRTSARAKTKAKTTAKAATPKKKTAGDPLAAVAVKTGSGASPLDVGRDLVAMVNGGQIDAVEAKHWSPRIESVEGWGVAQVWRGRKAAEAKNAWWASDHVVHAITAEGPYVGASGFAVKFRMDVETRSTGQRETMEEVGVYTVANGKIVREEFMYAVPG